MISSKERVDTDLLRRWFRLILCVGFIMFFVTWAPFEGLTPAGMTSIGIFLGSIILFITRPVPIAISCLTIMILMPLLGVYTYPQIWQDFGGSPFFFVLFSFGITAAITPTDIPVRVAVWIMKISKGNSKVIVYAFTFVTAITSGIVSNFPAVPCLLG